jgi:hypothetical protein
MFDSDVLEVLCSDNRGISDGRSNCGAKGLNFLAGLKKLQKAHLNAE